MAPFDSIFVMPLMDFCYYLTNKVIINPLVTLICDNAKTGPTIRENNLHKNTITYYKNQF